MGNFNSLFEINESKNKIYVCKNCLFQFSSENKYKEHIELGCNNREEGILSLPKNFDVMFKNYNRQHRYPLVIYADTECLSLKKNFNY